MKLLMLLIASLMFFVSTAALGDDHLQPQARYHLRSGDALTLVYRFTPELNQTVIIQSDGFVSLNVVGDLRLSGMTTTQAHDLIVQKATTRLNAPELNITLKEFEVPYIGIAGEVDKPGRVAFAEHTTALQAIMLSGGFKESAQRSQVVVFRKIDGNASTQTIHLDLRKSKPSRDPESDRPLQPGDIVFVPRSRLQNVGHVIKSLNLGL